MQMDANQTYYGDHFAIHTNTKLICGTFDTNTMLYVNHTSIKKKNPEGSKTKKKHCR